MKFYCDAAAMHGLIDRIASTQSIVASLESIVDIRIVCSQLGSSLRS